MEKKNYYEVKAMCGHVGKNNYIIITFPIACDSGKEAARITRDLPRVKHDRKDAIISVKNISFERYEELRKINSNDNYLQCTSKQEQRRNCSNLEDRIIRHSIEVKNVRESRKERKKMLEKMRRANKNIFVSNSRFAILY